MKKQLLTVFLFFFGAAFAQAQFNGEADSTFAVEGILQVDFSGGQSNDALSKAAFGPDGKLYMGGVLFENQTIDIVLARFHPDGTPDNTFGFQGITTFDPSLGGVDYLYDMILTDDGKIVVFGSVDTGTSDQLIARFHMSDGSLDDSFNGTGFLITGSASFDDEWVTGWVDADGNIIAAGYTSNGEGQNQTIVRYDINGEPDLTFGAGGFNVFDYGEYEIISRIYQHAPNRYYLLASVDGDRYLMALDGNGNLVTTFGSNGRIKIDPYPNDVVFLNALTTLPGGEIFLVGSRNKVGSDDDPMVIKLTAQGAYDPTFGINGVYAADLASGEDEEINDILFLENGAILLSGITERSGTQNFMTVILTPDGFLDSGYGELGVQEYPLAEANDEFDGWMCLDADGDIYVYGSSLGNTHSDAAVVKLKTTNPNTATEERRSSAFAGVALWPNPTAGELTVSYTLEEALPVQIQLQTLTGQRVATLQINQPFAGAHTIDASSLLQETLPGMYLLTLQAGHSVETQKIIIR